MGQLLDNSNRKIKYIYWEQPDISSTSGVVIRKMNYSGQTYLNLHVEVSGQSQTLNQMGMWWNNIFIDCMCAGTLYIYQH
jgi:hypothetical protein